MASPLETPIDGFTLQAPLSQDIGVGIQDTTSEPPMSRAINSTSSDISTTHDAYQSNGSVPRYTSSMSSMSSLHSEPQHASVSAEKVQPWPSDMQAQELFDLFFQRIHSIFPCIHEITFHSRFQERKGDSLHTSPLPWAIIAAASSLHRAPTIRHMRSLWLETAKSCFDKGATTTIFPTHVLQAAVWIIFVLYVGGNLNDASIFLGNACRLAQLFGFDRLDCCSSRQGAKFAPIARDGIEQEERRKTVWCLFLLDRQLSSLSGQSLAIDDYRFAVKFPIDNRAFQNISRNGVSRLLTSYTTFTNFSKTHSTLPQASPFTINLTQMFSSYFAEGDHVKSSHGLLLRTSVLLGRIVGLYSNLHRPIDSQEHKAEYSTIENATKFFNFAAFRDDERRENRESTEATIMLWANTQLRICEILLCHPDPSKFFQCVEAAKNSAKQFRSMAELCPQALQNPMLPQAIFLCCRCLIIDHGDNPSGRSRDDVDFFLTVLDRIGHTWPGITNKYRRAINQDLRRTADSLEQLKQGSGCYIDATCAP